MLRVRVLVHFSSTQDEFGELMNSPDVQRYFTGTASTRRSVDGRHGV